MGALFSAAVSWLVRTVIIKFIIFTALYLVVSAFIGYLSTKLPGPAALNSALGSWTPAMWYFADLTLWTQGFPAMIAAYVLRFAIRRMPVIG